MFVNGNIIFKFVKFHRSLSIAGLKSLSITVSFGNLKPSITVDGNLKRLKTDTPKGQTTINVYKQFMNLKMMLPITICYSGHNISITMLPFMMFEVPINEVTVLPFLMTTLVYCFSCIKSNEVRCFACSAFKTHFKI